MHCPAGDDNQASLKRLLPGYEPLPEWLGDYATWRHSALASQRSSSSLAALPIDLAPHAYVSKPEADSIVYTSSREWERVTKGATALVCRKRYVHGRVGLTGQSFLSPCGTWTCESCAVQTVLKHLVWLYKVFSELEEVRLIWLPDEMTDSESRALRRTRDNNDPSKPAWYVRLPLIDGRGVLVAVSGMPGGALGRATNCVVEAAVAFGAFRSELRLPRRLDVTNGNYAPSYQRGGEPPKWTSPMVTYVAGLTGNQSIEFERECERLALSRYGSGFKDLNATAMDDVGQDAGQHALRQPR